MRLFFKLAVRNLFRNKRRTFIAGTAIGIGLAALIFTDALIIGMEHNMIGSATASFLGEGQIHREGFRDSYDVERTIGNREEVIASLRQEAIVRDFSQRVISFGMLTSPANLSSVIVVGIDPETEPALSQVDEAIIEGAYFEGESERDVVIGSELAEILEVNLGSRVVLTTARAYTDDLAQEMFRVSGIYHFNSKEMDRSMAFIRIDKAQEMLAIGSEIHEIAIIFTDGSYGRNSEEPFWREYSRNGNEAVGWATLLPQLDLALKMSSFSTYIIALILFAVVALGIINTLFMSLHERMFEFGVLRAVGTRPLGMARLILLEAGALAVLSAILGVVIGYVVTYLTMQIGIDYTGIEYSGVTFREPLYPVLEIQQFIEYPIIVFFFTITAGLYPAIYAARMSPAEAMRRSV